MNLLKNWEDAILINLYSSLNFHFIKKFITTAFYVINIILSRRKAINFLEQPAESVGQGHQQ